MTCHQALGLDSGVEGTVPVNVLYDLLPSPGVTLEFGIHCPCKCSM